MAEMLDEASAIESTTVGVYRTAATVKGGRRFSFSAMVVVGDRNGQIGIGYGKANQVPPAIEKAQKEAKRKLKPYPMIGRTIPHAVTGRFGACSVRILPASPGTGVIAGAAVRAPLEMLGVQDCLTKSFGSNNSKNLVKAVVNGLEQLRSKESIEELRNVELETTAVEESIERGKAFMPTRKPEVVQPAAPEKADDAGKKSDKKHGRGKGQAQGKGKGRGKPNQNKQGQGKPAVSDEPKHSAPQDSQQSEPGQEKPAESIPPTPSPSSDEGGPEN